MKPHAAAAHVGSSSGEVGSDGKRRRLGDGQHSVEDEGGGGGVHGGSATTAAQLDAPLAAVAALVGSAIPAPRRRAGAPKGDDSTHRMPTPALSQPTAQHSASLTAVLDAPRRLLRATASRQAGQAERRQLAKRVQEEGSGAPPAVGGKRKRGGASGAPLLGVETGCAAVDAAVGGVAVGEHSSEGSTCLPSSVTSTCECWVRAQGALPAPTSGSTGASPSAAAVDAHLGLCPWATARAVVQHASSGARCAACERLRPLDVRSVWRGEEWSRLCSVLGRLVAWPGVGAVPPPPQDGARGAGC